MFCFVLVWFFGFCFLVLFFFFCFWWEGVKDIHEIPRSVRSKNREKICAREKNYTRQ